MPKKTHWVFKCRPKEIEIALLNPGWLKHTHQNSFTDGASDCFWTEEGESRGMGAKPPNKLQNSPTSESPTNFPSSAAFERLAVGISFPSKGRGGGGGDWGDNNKNINRYQPIVATSHFPPWLFSLIYWTTSKALALSCMLDLHPLKRKIFDAVSSMNTSLWFNDDREKGTCKHAYHWDHTQNNFQEIKNKDDSVFVKKIKL